MNTDLYRRLIVTSLAAFACMAGPVLAGGQPQEVTVFGDSLSDPGNVFALTGTVSNTPYAVIPSAPYTTGGLHFSNGKTWIEQSSVGDVNAQSSGPAYQVRGVFTNYAVGGARARPGSGGLVQADLTVQVQNYLADFGGARPLATHVIFIGGNDIRDALQAGCTAASFAILNDAVSAVAGNIQTLYSAGATRFVVVNGPDVGLVPAVLLTGNPAIEACATALSVGYNGGLATAVANLNAVLPGIHIALVDLFGFLHEVVADPSHYGLTDVTDMCITPGVKGNAKCSNPKDYLFWDGIHPTTAGHALLADLIGPSL